MTKEDFKNLGIGETFNIGVHKFKVYEKKKEYKFCDCENCSLYKGLKDFNCWEGVEYGIIPECLPTSRKDKKSVIFIEVEDVWFW